MTTAARRFAILLVLSAGLAAAAEPAERAEGIPRIIFDSDMSSDHDDVGDIATLHGLASLGECRILAMMVSSTNGGTALCMDAINTYYGRPGIPIGVPPDIGGVGGYAGQIAAEFPHALKSAKDCPVAADLYRQVLAAQPDRSVTIVTTGYLVNLQALLASGPDTRSPLSGVELVRRKVKLLSCAAGCFPKGNEFNLRVMPDAAFAVVNSWPTRVMYVGYDVGQAVYTCGRLKDAPATNPIRRVYVDIKNQLPYPSWGQIMVYYAVREQEGLWGAETTGRNHCDKAGGNWWSTDSDPAGDQDQGYLLEIARTPARDGIDAVIMLPPKDGTPSRPGEPSNVRATVVGGDRIDLRWTDNAFNETGFRIERRVAGVFTTIATVGADVTTYADKGLPSLADVAYRVTATNAVGDSLPSPVWVYSGWTELDLGSPGNLPLYTYHQCSDLRWSRGGDFRPDHVTLNNDSTHGTDVAIDVDVGAMGSEGSFYVYFLYQDQDNWYRLNADGKTSRFEKRIGGVTTPVGPAGAGVNIGNGSPLRAWHIAVTSTGALTFVQDGIVVLEAAEPLGLATGRIGLGGVARTPVWENFRFDTGAARARK
jgi:hypothetical protein